jgi:hypothetical protein
VLTDSCLGKMIGYVIGSSVKPGKHLAITQTLAPNISKAGVCWHPCDIEWRGVTSGGKKSEPKLLQSAGWDAQHDCFLE